MSDQPRGKGHGRRRKGGGQSDGGGQRDDRGQQGSGGRQGQGGKRRGGRRQGQGRQQARGGRGGSDDPIRKLTGPLQKVLKRLPDAQREVIEWRMGLKDGHPHNLADTAREMGLSMSEARDIEKRAFEHIREAVPVEHLQKFLQDGR